MLVPKNKILKSYGRCFYGHAFGKHTGLKAEVENFLKAHNMTVQPDVPPGEWLWEALTRSMSRSAFCAFETVSENRNVHIELGYALARRLRVALLVQISREHDQDITVNRHIPAGQGSIRSSSRQRADLLSL